MLGGVTAPSAPEFHRRTSTYTRPPGTSHATQLDPRSSLPSRFEDENVTQIARGLAGRPPGETAGFTKIQHCRWLRIPVVTLLLPVGSGSDRPLTSSPAGPAFVRRRALATTRPEPWIARKARLLRMIASMSRVPRTARSEWRRRSGRRGQINAPPSNAIVPMEWLGAPNRAVDKRPHFLRPLAGRHRSRLVASVRSISGVCLLRPSIGLLHPREALGQRRSRRRSIRHRADAS
jgi:hypothetical protein